jgi:dimethylamine/trimethylamine dehydrogenase
MDKQDIANLRRWHKQAAVRSKQADFDIVYVYAAHGLGGLNYFLSRRHNDRSDEYGGSLENRIRLVREIVEDTKDAVGDSCAVALRFTVDELMGEDGLHKDEAHEMIGLMAELPDLWDLVLAGWENDSQTSRFGEQALQEPFVAGVKQLTSKPVVGVGWFTSPDTMVSQIRRGVLDLIGAARPSIADPWLPRKIDEGRVEVIRECIGCNICVSGDMTGSPIRCTQNPTMGEEWRKGWHPERIAPKGSDDKVLVVGAGPAGMEAARALGQRGYDVVLAEAGTERGGRVVRESLLPGLSAWIRVKDYRELQLQVMAKVETYFDSRLTADDILAFGFEHVAVATGSSWRRDGVARTLLQAVPVEAGAEILTPDDLMDGKRPAGGHVLVYDDDHYYMGGVLAELLAGEDYHVTLVTPAPDVSSWTHNTLEQGFIQKRILELGIEIRPQQALASVKAGAVETACVFTGRKTEIVADSVVMVTASLPDDQLYLDLQARRDDWADAGIKSVKVIGDAAAPGPIAYAVYTGHRYARELDAPDIGDAVPFKRELTELAPLG